MFEEIGGKPISVLLQKGVFYKMRYTQQRRSEVHFWSRGLSSVQPLRLSIQGREVIARLLLTSSISLPQKGLLCI